jgi:hypothetical protein
LSGLAWLLFGSTFPCFNPKISKSDTDNDFLSSAASFLKWSGVRPAAGGGDTYCILCFADSILAGDRITFKSIYFIQVIKKSWYADILLAVLIQNYLSI